jgi:hypothetical protein
LPHLGFDRGRVPFPGGHGSGVRWGGLRFHGLGEFSRAVWGRATMAECRVNDYAKVPWMMGFNIRR